MAAKSLSVTSNSGFLKTIFMSLLVNILVGISQVPLALVIAIVEGLVNDSAHST